jgi:drug/metabolite transporter (DMT)-like permease
MSVSDCDCEAPPRRITIAAGTTTYLWLAVMVVLWGLSWPATKVALGVVPPLWLAAMRFGTAAVCLFIFVGMTGKLRFPPRQDWSIVASMGFLQMMAFTGLGMIAMTHTDTSRAVLLAYTTPLWAVLMGWLLFRQTPTRRQLMALAVGLAGIAIICSPYELDWRNKQTIIGCFFLLIGAVCWSVVILHIRRHSWMASPVSLAPWQMLIATVPLAGIAYTVEGKPTGIHFDKQLLELLFFIGPIATSACFVISAEYGRRITAFAMSNLTLGVPLIGIISSVAVLGNNLTGSFMLGLVLVVAGMIMAALASKVRKASKG